MSLNFAISPMSQNLNLNPGQTTNGTISVFVPEDATGALTYNVSVVPYNVSGEDYTIDTETIGTYSQIAQWISITDPTGTVQPGDTKTINFSISVPKNAPSGTQSAALIVAPESSDTTTENIDVSSTFSMGSIIYANISGETHQGGEILTNNVPAFTISIPVSVSARLTNTGNIYETAKFTISATNLLNGQAILSEDSTGGNTFSEIILPETTRLVSREIDNLPAVGIVHLEQTILFEGQTSSVSQNLIICPIWVSVLAIMIIVAVISSIIVFVRHRRRKRQLI